MEKESQSFRDPKRREFQNKRSKPSRPICDIHTKFVP